MWSWDFEVRNKIQQEIRNLQTSRTTRDGRAVYHIEAVQVHDLVPGRNEVTDELGLTIVATVQL